MPGYEYGCRDCRKRVVVYQTYEDYGHVPVQCPECGGENLKRLIGHVRIARSEDAHLESMADPDSWGDIDENDPKSMARMMKKLGSEMGEDLGPEFSEMVDRLEAGEDPESIEQSMGDDLSEEGEGSGGSDYDNLF